MRLLLFALLLMVPVASAGVTETAMPARLGSPLAVEVADDGGVWITSDAGWALVRLDPTTGAFAEHPLASARADGNDSLYSLALGAGAAWTASQRSVHRVDLATGEARAFDLSPASGISGGVLVAADGRAWASLVTRDQVVRLDPATGEPRAFDAPPGGGPLLFAPAGPGRAYLTLTYANALALLDTTTGAVTKVAEGIQAPTGVAFDGASAWVGEHGGSSIVRVDAQGNVERFPVAASPYYPISGPNGVAIGKDGAVWTAVHFADRVARLDPVARTLVEYEVASSPGANVQHLAVAPDGKVWFAQWSAGKVGHAEPGGEALDVQLPANLSVRATGSASAPLSGAGLRVSTGMESLTGKVEDGRLVVEAKDAPPGTHHVLVYRQDGKTFVGRYVDVVVMAAEAPFPAWLPIAAAAGALILRRRRA